jgi:hypothetical protein
MFYDRAPGYVYIFDLKKQWIPTAGVLHPYPNQRFCV